MKLEAGGGIEGSRGESAPAGRIDAVVVGAGFAGLYALHRLSKLDFLVRCFEAAPDVGGTWHWNKYPGARCDVESFDYSYSFSDELQQSWRWSERFAPQPEILRYIRHVADTFHLRRFITFNTRVVSVRYLDEVGEWEVQTSTGEIVRARYCIMASGNLSTPRTPDIPGIETFQGKVYHSARWPAQGVDFSGQRVGVIGTGSTGIQMIPLIAEQAERLFVFQRTPNFCLPAQNVPITEDADRQLKQDYAERRRLARQSSDGIARPFPPSNRSALDASPEERQRIFEERWSHGSGFLSAFNDLLVNEASNAVAAEFVRRKIRQIVRDPVVAEKLCPTDHPIGARRVCVGTSYYETYNKPNVQLVDLLSAPIREIHSSGVRTEDVDYPLDVLVFATGFDAMTGALREMNIQGRGGLPLTRKWASGPKTYLGIVVNGFPNMFLITGPGSPSVKSNVVHSIEQHVDWVTECLAFMRREQHASIEPTQEAEEAWGAHVTDVANRTLFPKADSWYMGSNVPGKPRVFMPYVGGVHVYRQICEEVAQQGYRGFEFSAERVTAQRESR